MYKIRLTVLAFLVMALAACKKPTENIKIIVDTDIIKHTAMINVTDAQTGALAPSNATITVTGAQAANVYELSGKKNIVLNNGLVTIGLHPDAVPTAAAPITITVEISAPGYNKETKQITFNGNVKQQVVSIAISKVGNTAPVIVLPPLPVYNNTTLTFTGRCPSRADVQVRPSVYVFFKKSGTSEPFRYLGYIDKGTISTNLLALGQSYDFQIAFGGEAYTTTQKIDLASYDLTIDMPAACNF